MNLSMQWIPGMSAGPKCWEMSESLEHGYRTIIFFICCKLQPFPQPNTSDVVQSYQSFCCPKDNGGGGEGLRSSCFVYLHQHINIPAQFYNL